MFKVSDPRSIKTIAIHTDDVEKSLRGEVLKEAFEKFGYTADSFDAVGPLAKILSKLGIMPLDPEQVEIYKRSKEKEYSVSPRTIVNISVPVALFLAVWGILFEIVHRVNGPDVGNAIGFVMAFALIGLALFYVIFNCGFEDHLPRKKVKQYWKGFSFGSSERTRREYVPEYKKYIPIHVLNLANQIRKEEPLATFTVEELTREVLNVPKPLPDPFMKVSYGSESYYIAVWDEREFEKRM